jgi:hypothetical protein
LCVRSVDAVGPPQHDHIETAARIARGPGLAVTTDPQTPAATYKTQALSVYRKLGASTRSQAVQRAQQLGLGG